MRRGDLVTVARRGAARQPARRREDLAACERRKNFSQPCGARFTDLEFRNAP